MWKLLLGLLALIIGLFVYQMGPEQRPQGSEWKVTLEQGIVEETSDLIRSRDSQLDIHSFYGIPFGEALRFRKPDPVQGWRGVLKADRSSIMCLQANLFFPYPSVVGQEDCLVVNVHTTSKKVEAEKDLLPVLVFIHGGGFTAGSGGPEMYGPQYFMDHPIVMVTLNYRLGALGFMGMDDDTMPGNLGLWDQRLALQWVQKNIRAFGGDPGRVTLMGQSAGGMSAHFHQLSPASKGLFHAVIVQSGIVTIPYGKSDHHPAYYTRTLAQHVGCVPEMDSHQVLTCLSLVEPEKIYDAGLTIFKEFGIFPSPFKPHLDNKTSEPFLPADPWELMESGRFNDVPSIQGYNEEDGLLFTALYARMPQLFEETTKNWYEVAPLMLFNREKSEVGQDERNIAQHYLEEHFKGQLPTKVSEMQKLTEFFTMAYEVTGSTGVLEMARKGKSPVYPYLYGHQGAFSLADLVAHRWWQLLFKLISQKLFGTDAFTLGKMSCHSDEMFIMFDNAQVPYVTIGSQEDLETSRLMVRLWANFARFHNPTPDASEGVKWPSIHPKDPSPNQAYIRDGKLSIIGSERVIKEKEDWAKFSKVPHFLHHYKSESWQNPRLFKKKQGLPLKREL